MAVTLQDMMHCQLTLPNPVFHILLEIQTFWDSFDAAVHSNPILSKVQKFNYLWSQLQDDAAKTIAGFPLTNENYDHSLALLKERFGQSHKIVNAHMQSLLALPNPSNNLLSLRSFYDSVENHIHGLSALGKSKDSYGALLVPIVLGKLPIETRRNLARGSSSQSVPPGMEAFGSVSLG